MSQTDNTPSRSQELLSAKLRQLARSSTQAASPELGIALVRAFQRHHRRRKGMRVAAIAAVILAIACGSLWHRFASDHPASAKQVAVINQTFGARQETSANRLENMFVALPSFAFSRPDEDLRVIRVEMPVSSLRLLGARVNDDLITQRVVADLLVGTDGTPYAFRLVS
jgi:hypothetical protein